MASGLPSEMTLAVDPEPTVGPMLDSASRPR